MAASSPDRSGTGQVQDDEQAYLLLERLRWAGTPRTCPHCASPGPCYLLRPMAGTRRTRTGAPTARRLWKCGICRRQFTVLTGTVLHGTRVPLAAWITAIALLADPQCAATATDVGRATGLGREAARHVIARWRAATAVEPLRALTGDRSQLFQG